MMGGMFVCNLGVCVVLLVCLDRIIFVVYAFLRVCHIFHLFVVCVKRLRL